MVRASDSVRLTVTGHFNESSAYNHAGEWELMQVGTYWSWASTGPNTGLPKAGSSFVVQGAQAFFALDADSLISTRRLVTMVGAKLYGMLNDEQDMALKTLIENQLENIE